MKANLRRPVYPKYHVDMETFGLCCEDAQDTDDKRLRIKGSNQLTQVYLLMAVKMVCVRVKMPVIC